MSQPSIVAGIDLGGTKIRVGLVSTEGKVMLAETWPTPGEQGPDAVIRCIAEGVQDLLQRILMSRANVRAVGIGGPGPINDKTGIVSVMPNLPGWEQFPLRSRLEERLGLPVRVGNDGNLGALGEHRFGAGVGSSDMVYVALGTGVGGGIIVNNQLLSGATGAAGEIGHIILDPEGPVCNCGNRGCLEAYSSGRGLERRAEEVLRSGRATLMAEYASEEAVTINTRIIERAAREGDPAARELLAQAARYLGFGVLSLVHIFNPEMVVFGGGLVALSDLLVEPAIVLVRKLAFDQHQQGLRFAYAGLGDDVVVLGAAALAMEAPRL